MKNHFPAFSRQTHGPVLAALALLAVLLMLPTGFEGRLTYQNADRVRAEVLATDESDIMDTGLIRTGEAAEQPLAEFAAFVKSALSCPGLRFADAGRPVRRVAVGGGSCGGAIDDVLAAGCDTLVTADLKYNHFEEAKYRGLNLIDAGHFETENPVCAVLERVLREALPELTVLRAKAHKDETQFL